MAPRPAECCALSRALCWAVPVSHGSNQADSNWHILVDEAEVRLKAHPALCTPYDRDKAIRSRWCIPLILTLHGQRPTVAITIVSGVTRELRKL